MDNELKWINTFAFLGMILMNALANLLPIGNNTTGEVAAKYPNLFTPAPLTFSIWGVIYILMAFFTLFQWGFLFNEFASYVLRVEIGSWFAISCILNVAWLMCWHLHYIGSSVIFIIGLLVSLLMIKYQLRDYSEKSIGRRISECGFDLYIGWITVATIANVSVFLVKIKWNRFGLSEQFWTVLMLVIGTVIGVAFVQVHYRLYSTLAIIWAYIGILIKHFSSNGYSFSYPLIVTSACLGIFIMLVAIFASAPRSIHATTQKTLEP